MIVRRLTPFVVAAAAVAALPGASASAAGWTCEASALRAGILTAPVVEPAIANAASASCVDDTEALAAPLPTLLGSATITAATVRKGDPAAPAAQSIAAAGGIADLKAGSLSALGLPVPQVELPADIGKLTVSLAAANALLPTTVITVPAIPAIPAVTIPGVPPLFTPIVITPAVPAVPAVTVPVPKLPASIELDATAAIELLRGALRTLPDLTLLELKGAMAYASGSCVDQKPVLSGVSQVAGLKVLGRELPTDRAVTESISLLDAGTLDLSAIDASALPLPASVTGVLAQLDALPLLPALKAQVLTKVNQAVAAAVAALPELPIPGALASVEVRPGEQTRTDSTLTQKALSIKLSVLGQAVLDLDLGRATVGSGDVSCTRSATVVKPGVTPIGKPGTSPTAAGDVAPDTVTGAVPPALRCTTRALTLTGVTRGGGRVRLVGAADRRFVGQVVRIVFARGRTVATAIVAKDGSFATSAPLPPKAIRDTDAARYQAVIGKERSLDLKLARRMVVRSLVQRDGKVVITGQVIGALTTPVAPITVQRRVSCTSFVTAGRVTPDSDGSFRAVVDAPPSGQAGVYRLLTEVRANAKNPKRFPTFTLPQGVSLTS